MPGWALMRNSLFFLLISCLISKELITKPTGMTYWRQTHPPGMCGWHMLILKGRIKRNLRRYSCSLMYFIFDTMAVCDIADIFECSTANSPGQDIFGQAQTKEQQQCCNGTLKPLIPLLMHSYKYSTSKNLSRCRPTSAQGMQSRMGIYY